LAYVCYITGGNIAFSVLQEKLIVGVEKPAYHNALKEPGTTPFDTIGRPIAGWVFVDSSAFKNDQELRNWVKQGVVFALTLPKN